MNEYLASNSIIYLSPTANGQIENVTHYLLQLLAIDDNDHEPSAIDQPPIIA